jgi:hypothetical protein
MLTSQHSLPEYHVEPVGMDCQHTMLDLRTIFVQYFNIQILYQSSKFQYLLLYKFTTFSHYFRHRNTFHISINHSGGHLATRSNPPPPPPPHSPAFLFSLLPSSSSPFFPPPVPLSISITPQPFTLLSGYMPACPFTSLALLYLLTSVSSSMIPLPWFVELYSGTE